MPFACTNSTVLSKINHETMKYKLRVRKKSITKLYTCEK